MKKASERLSHPYLARLILWMIVLNAIVAALRFLPEVQMTWENSVCHALMEVCGALIASGVAFCFWVQYRVSTKHQMLLACIAFSGLTFGQLVHALTAVAASGGWDYAGDIGHQFYGIWRFAAGLLLVAAARNYAKDSKSQCRRQGLRLLWGTQAVFVFIGGVVVLIGQARLNPHTVMSSSELSWLGFISRMASSSALIHAFDALAMMAGLAAFAWRYMEEEDAFSDSIVRCLALALTGMVAGVLSKSEYDMSWWVSHVFAVFALLVLLIELAREFGASYADAQTRVEHLEAVHRISSQLGNTLDLRVVLLVLVSDIADLLQARYAAVMMVDDTGETLRTVATHGLPESPLRSSDPQKIDGGGRPGFYSGHTARAFREKCICMVDDVFTDVEFVSWKLLAKNNGYAVSVPLVYQDVAFGVLNLFFDKHIPINDERIRLFETLASSAAVSIANAQLYDRALEAHPTESDATNLFRLRLAS